MQYLDTERFPLPEGYRFRSITVRRMTVDDLRLITAGYDTVPEDEEERMRMLEDGYRYCLVAVDDMPFHGRTSLMEFRSFSPAIVAFIRIAFLAINTPEHIAEILREFWTEMRRKRAS